MDLIEDSMRWNLASSCVNSMGVTVCEMDLRLFSLLIRRKRVGFEERKGE